MCDPKPMTNSEIPVSLLLGTKDTLYERLNCLLYEYIMLGEHNLDYITRGVKYLRQELGNDGKGVKY